MAVDFYCWQCNVKLQDVILPISRREECYQCGKDIHVCKMCDFYEPNKGCQEERADHQRELELANFCDYFKPSNQPFPSSNQTKSDLAKAQLAALFGDVIEDNRHNDTSLSATELAEKKLRDMLNNLL